MNDFVKGMLLTAAPALVLGAISAVGVVNSSGENGILFLFVWLLALLALVTLAIKSIVQWRHEREMEVAARIPPERPALNKGTS